MIGSQAPQGPLLSDSRQANQFYWSCKATPGAPARSCTHGHSWTRCLTLSDPIMQVAASHHQSCCESPSECPDPWCFFLAFIDTGASDTVVSHSGVRKLELMDRLHHRLSQLEAARTPMGILKELPTGECNLRLAVDYMCTHAW